MTQVETISVTKGVVSRVEPRQYAHCETQLMVVQISLLMGRRKGRKLIFNTDEQRVHSIRIVVSLFVVPLAARVCRLHQLVICSRRWGLLCLSPDR